MVIKRAGVSEECVVIIGDVAWHCRLMSFMSDVDMMIDTMRNDKSVFTKLSPDEKYIHGRHIGYAQMNGARCKWIFQA